MVDNDFLNFLAKAARLGYCVFAEVVDGMDVETNQGVATGRSGMHQDVPKEDVIIEARPLGE